MRVYFAHPCFTEDQRALKKAFLDRLSPLIEGSGIEIVDPFDYTPIIEDNPEKKLELAEEIKRECIRLLESCDVVLALLDYNDTGTAFEVGYAHAVGKPVILISSGECSSANAMLLGAGKAVIERVLEGSQMERLALLLKWFEKRGGDGNFSPGK
ncbi:MAG: nucleoside 2-deoxyribosyltransferase [Candidatus Methanomethyliaceae archaeon]